MWISVIALKEVFKKKIYGEKDSCRWISIALGSVMPGCYCIKNKFREILKHNSPIRLSLHEAHCKASFLVFCLVFFFQF